MTTLWLSLLLLAGFATANLNILMTNDDGFGSANIRATKEALENQGHKVLIVGPLDNQSGTGGTVVLPTSNVSESGGLYGLIEPGSYWVGQEFADDPSIRYFNGTPAACALWALTQITDDYFGGPPDLVVSGINTGTNLGQFVYSLSGTCGAAYSSVMWGVPAIAFSAADANARPYTNLTDDPLDTSRLAAGLAANLVSALADGQKEGEPVLPLGVGLNVNFPQLNASCSEPPYVLSRMSGGAYINNFVLNDDGFPQWINDVRPGLNRCTAGDCSLPGETEVVTACSSSISVFSVNYDAPESLALPVQNHLKTYLAPRANSRIRRDARKRRALALNARN